MPREHEWDSRWWSPIINAEHLRMREAAGVIDLSRVRDLRHHRSRRPGGRAAHLRRAVRRRRRQGHLHAGARRARRLPLRPDRDAARRRPLPGGHRRRARHGRPQVVRRPAARRRRDDASTDLTDEVSTIGLWGPRARDILASLTATTSPRRLRVPHLPRDHRRRRDSRCSPRGSPTSASWAGSSTSPMDDARRAVGDAARGGRAARRRPGRHRRLRHDRPDREGLPRLRLRARRRAHHRRGRHAAAQGQGRRLRRQGGLPRAARGRRPRRCSAR